MSDDKGIKIVLLGEAGVGKTNLIQVSIGKKFDDNTSSTLTGSYVEKEYIFENKRYVFDLWDTVGQELYRSLSKLFIKNSKIVIIVFAINSRPSFEQIDFWYNSVKESLGNDGYITALVGNKSDLYEDPEAIPDEEMEKKAKEMNFKLKITSACKDAEGFKSFLNELMEDYIKIYKPEGVKDDGKTKFKIGGDKSKTKGKKKCC